MKFMATKLDRIEKKMLLYLAKRAGDNNKPSENRVGLYRTDAKIINDSIVREMRLQ